MLSLLKVKLIGFKAAYNLENTADANHVTFEHVYDVNKRIIVKKEKLEEF